MALPSVVDALEGLEEPVRKFYIKGEDGRFVLDADVEAHPTVERLRNTAQARKSERDELDKQLKPWKALGLTVEQIAEIRQKAEAAGAAGASHAEVEKLVEKRVKEALDKVKPDLDERDALRAENRKLTLTDNIRAAFLEAGGLEEDADDVVRLYEDRFDLGDKNEKTGKRKVIVKDEDGDPSGLTPKEWFEKELKKKRPKFFKGTNAAGSGAQGGGGSGAASDLDKLPPAARIAEARRRGATK